MNKNLYLAGILGLCLCLGTAAFASDKKGEHNAPMAKEHNVPATNSTSHMKPMHEKQEGMNEKKETMHEMKEKEMKK